MEKCSSYSEQAKIFTVKVPPLLKDCLYDTNGFKAIQYNKEFRDFIELLGDFISKILCDTHYLVDETIRESVKYPVLAPEQDNRPEPT
mmetsp:Transcript_34719/g.53282  ORF Transcript_34719/g.53282 Transcript_34719/m.53282 type:complete len:88 (-) Transcript_34719:2404-2667(-)